MPVSAGSTAPHDKWMMDWAGNRACKQMDLRLLANNINKTKTENVLLSDAWSQSPAGKDPQWDHREGYQTNTGGPVWAYEASCGCGF